MIFLFANLFFLGLMAKMLDEQLIFSEQAMQDLGYAMAQKWKPNDYQVIALIGDLGAGKTNWTKGFLRGLGLEEPIVSPTFSLVHEYTLGDLKMNHMDWYRLRSPQELEGIGWYEMLDLGVLCIVEWANLFPEYLPEQTVCVLFEYVEQGTRKVQIRTLQELRVNEGDSI